jgi:rhamnogalacturonan hydrolase
MILVESTTDFELYSSTSKGAMQGYGYTFHACRYRQLYLLCITNASVAGTYGPRLLRLQSVTDFSVHDIALVDCKLPEHHPLPTNRFIAPAFHFTMDTCINGEVYNMIIRGGNEGGLDGVDVWGTNIWVHDVEVTNKDECVTVKSPASHMLIEDIYCNWSGGCAIGSLGADTSKSLVSLPTSNQLIYAISHIQHRIPEHLYMGEQSDVYD